MPSERASRRTFLARSLTGIGSTWVTASWSEIFAAHQHAQHAAAADPPAKFEFLTSGQAAVVEAMAAQIIPADDTPGAREARVIYFVDRALSTFDREKQSIYVKGLDALQEQCALKFGPVGKFSELSPAQQVEVLQAIEKTEFFEVLRTHTIVGFFANPEYGGNHSQIGWKLIGFEDQFRYEPPFGYYDAQENAGQAKAQETTPSAHNGEEV